MGGLRGVWFCAWNRRGSFLPGFPSRSSNYAQTSPPLAPAPTGEVALDKRREFPKHVLLLGQCVDIDIVSG